MKGLALLALILIAIISISGCTSSKDYVQPTGQIVSQPTQESTIKTFKIGETATNGKLAVTLNNVRYSEVVDEKDNQFLVAEASEGKKFAIVDVTLENLEKDKTHPISSIMLFKLRDKEGYGYDLDFRAFTALDKACKCDGDLLPRMKMRGELPFEVPKDVQGLQFHFLYGIGETTAVFNL